MQGRTHSLIPAYGSMVSYKGSKITLVQFLLEYKALVIRPTELKLLCEQKLVRPLWLPTALPLLLWIIIIIIIILSYLS